MVGNTAFNVQPTSVRDESLVHRLKHPNNSNLIEPMSKREIERWISDTYEYLVREDILIVVSVLVSMFP